MNENEFIITLLSYDDKDRKSIRYYNYGLKSAGTDLAILNGLYLKDSEEYNYSSDDKSYKGRSCWWWTKDITSNSKIESFSPQNRPVELDKTERGVGIRPVLMLDKKTFLEVTKNAKKMDNYNVYSVSFGEYPQYISDIQEELENEYNNGNLSLNGCTYTFDRIARSKKDQEFLPVTYDEYEYKGKKYIRFKCKTNNEELLSNGDRIKENNYYWLEVSPVEWLVEKKDNMLISKRCILSGNRFDSNYNNYESFDRTELGMYLNKYMLHELFQHNKLVINKELPPIQVIEENIINDKKTKGNEIDELLDKIDELSEFYYGDDNLKQKAHDIVSKYIENINNIKKINPGEIVLSTTVMDEDLLYSRLMVDLERIYNILDENYKNNKEYVDMLLYTKECKSVLEGNTEYNKADILLRDLYQITNVVVPYIDDKTKIDYLNKIFSELEMNISNYLKGNKESEIKDIKTIKDFKLHINRLLTPFLQDLNISVRNKDIIDEIRKGYIELSNNIFKNSKDNHIGFYLNETQNVIKQIMSLGNDNDLEKLKQLFSNNTSFDNLDVSLNTINELYRSVYRILMDINDRKERDKKLSEMVPGI